MWTSGAARLRLACKFRSSVDGVGNTAATWRAVRTAKPCGPGRRCYGQAGSKMRASPTGWTASSNSNGEGGQRKVRLPGERGISRPTIAQGRPSDRHHLYAAVRFFLRVHFRAADRGCALAPGLPCALLALRVEQRSKARAKRAARLRRRVCHHAHSVIAREGGRSSTPRRQ